MKNVLQILQYTEPSLSCDDDLTVEIDFEALKPKTLNELRKYVDSCMLNVQTTSNNMPPNPKICNQSSSPGLLSRIPNFDLNCDNNSHNLSRANSRASNIQLSEPSSSDSEVD